MVEDRARPDHGGQNAKNSYYRAQFLRLKARRGPQKAICAVAASILRAIYHMLTNGTVHEDSAPIISIDVPRTRKPSGSPAKSKGSAIR